MTNPDAVHCWDPDLEQSEARKLAVDRCCWCGKYRYYVLGDHTVRSHHGMYAPSGASLMKVMHDGLPYQLERYPARRVL